MSDDAQQKGSMRILRNFDQIPSFITSDARHLYIAFIGPKHFIARLGLDGRGKRTIAVYPDSLTPRGLAFGPDGFLYACVTSTPPGANRIDRIAPDGSSRTTYATIADAGLLNDLAFDDRGSLYVTDSTLGVVFFVGRGGAPIRTWLRGPLLRGTDPPLVASVPLGANGIIFRPADKSCGRPEGMLYIANTDRGTILRVGIRRRGDGCPTRPKGLRVHASSPFLVGTDSIRMDARAAQIFAANVFYDSLWTVSPDGHRVTRITSGYPVNDGTSGLQILNDGAEKTVIAYTNSGYFRAVGLVPGSSRPSLGSLVL